MRRFSRNFAFGEYISPSPLVSELPDALRADMRTGFCCARRARRARFDERVAPPTNEKSNPVGLLRSLGRVDKKDAVIFCNNICHLCNQNLLVRFQNYIWESI